MSDEDREDNLAPSLTTGGGAVFSGDVNSHGGDVIGRDQINVYVGHDDPRLPYRDDIAYRVDYYTKVFVGRREILGSLEDFAAVQAPAYILVEGPAGYGKSALASQLIRLATTNPPPRLAHLRLLYFFIREESQQHTAAAFLGALNSQLLEMLGRTGGITTNLQTLYDQFRELWVAAAKGATEHRPLLLLVDGLDEMSMTVGERTIADVLPTYLAPYVHVIVTSRPVPAAKQSVALEHPFYRANVLPLQTFSHEEVRALLEQQQLPPDRVGDLAARVFHMTKGEPLFARFVCADIGRDGEAVLVRLEVQPPVDVQDYFSQQLKQLKKQLNAKRSWDVLGVLGVSVGWLTAEELADILHVPKREINQAIDPIQRFLLGTSRLELMHVELLKGVRLEFTPGEQATYRNKLLDFCAHWHDHNYFYALEHYAQHLFEAGGVKELTQLVWDPTWHRARRQHDMIGAGLARDVRFAQQALEDGGVGMLPDYLAVAYLQAKLQTGAINLPVEVLRALTRLGHVQEASAVAGLLIEEARQVDALAIMALACLDVGDIERAVVFARAARDGLAGFEVQPSTLSNLARVAGLFGRAHDVHEMGRTVEMAFAKAMGLDGLDKCLGLARIIADMIDYEPPMRLKYLARAEEIARQILKVDSYRAGVLVYIADGLGPLNPDHARTLVLEAVVVLQTAPQFYVDEGISGTTFSQRNYFLPKAIGVAVQLDAEAEALALLDLLAEPRERCEAYTQLVRAYIQLDRFDTARGYIQDLFGIVTTKLLGKIQDSGRATVVKLLLEMGELEQAKEVAGYIEDDIDRVNAFCDVTRYLTQRGKVEDARRWLTEMQRAWGQAFGHLILGECLLESDPDVALAELNEALRHTSNIRGGIVGMRQQVHANIGRFVTQLIPTQPAAAERVLRELVSEIQSEAGQHELDTYALIRARDNARSSLANDLIATGQGSLALAIASSIESQLVRDWTYCDALRSACSKGEWEVASALRSRITNAFWQVIGQVVSDGWKFTGRSLPDDLLDNLQVQLPRAGNELGYPATAFGLAAIELGLAGHLEAADTLFGWFDPSSKRQELQVDLIRLLTQAGRLDEARRISVSLKYGDFKATARAYIARALTQTDQSEARRLVSQAWVELNPYGLPWEHGSVYGSNDEALTVLAGTVAAWDCEEADGIVNRFIKEEKNRRKGRGEIISMLAPKDPEEACRRLVELLRTGVNGGLAGYWEVIEAASPGILTLIGAQKLSEWHQQVIGIERRWHMAEEPLTYP